jgi:RNA polymerase II subunit A small phosphatase-like protein
MSISSESSESSVHSEAGGDKLQLKVSTSNLARMPSFSLTPFLPVQPAPPTLAIPNPTPETIMAPPSAKAPVTADPNAPLLPKPAPADADRICLVLDLDETLIHSSFLEIPNFNFSFSFGTEEAMSPVYVLIRPGAEQLLRELGPLYELVVFTAGIQPYADIVIDHIDPEHHIRFRLYRDSCTEFGGSMVKDLGRLNRPLERIIILDNSPSAYVMHPYNAIPIESWFDEPTDRALFSVIFLLKNSYRIRNIYDLLRTD